MLVELDDEVVDVPVALVQEIPETDALLDSVKSAHYKGHQFMNSYYTGRSDEPGTMIHPHQKIQFEG